jgi:predicted enzyme related to lactoylglutathione lyase
MGTRTSHRPGTFSWVDLQTSDPAAAQRFYSELFDWEYDERPAGDDATYAMALVGGEDTGAIAPMPPGAQFPPHWNSYVTVESADATAERARELGGSIPMEPFDVFDAGRMAVIVDPTGAALCAWEPREHPGAHRVNDPGCFTWNELGTTDLEAATRFYGELFGWTFEDQDMGGGAVYRTIRNDERTNGGIRAQTEAEAGIPPSWLVYFTTEDADASVARATELGANVLAPVMQLPMGSRIAVLADPQGAAFALFEGEIDD